MAWIVSLKIVDCAATSTLLAGARISSPLLNPPGYVTTDANGEAQIFDAYDVWEWVNLTITKSGTGDPCHPEGYDPGYLAKNFVIHMDMDGTTQTVCLNKAPHEECNPDGGTPDCFIVTAATGSASSAEVTALRALRERVKARSRLGAELVDAIYGEYERFSPPIAARLGADAAARGLVLRSVVEPLFAWYALAGALALDPDDAELRNRAEAAFGAARPQGDGLGVAGLLEALRGGAPLPPFLPKALVELAPRPDAFPFAAWAILDPLIRIWRGAGKPFAAVAAIGEWLAAAPLERLPRRPGVPDLAIELETVAGFLAFAPERRRELGQRLLAAWPDAAAALARAGLTPRPDRPRED